jgi:type IV pilus assembly protein PilX
MTRNIQESGRKQQRGVILISTLLLLIIMTIFAVSMFRSVTVQEMIAGNVREKQRSLHAAQSALQYAEYWLSSGNNSILGSSACTTPVVSANTGTVFICNSPLTTPASPPWGGASEIGFSYNPGTSDITVSSTPGPGTYNELPRFYIYDLGTPAAGGCRQAFQIDAWSYAGTTNTITEVESQYQIVAIACTG